MKIKDFQRAKNLRFFSILNGGLLRKPHVHRWNFGVLKPRKCFAFSGPENPLDFLGNHWSLQAKMKLSLHATLLLTGGS